MNTPYPELTITITSRLTYASFATPNTKRSATFLSIRPSVEPFPIQ